MQHPSQSGRSKIFEFQHAVFKLRNARFLLSADATPSLALPLGDLEVLVPLQSLAMEFDLTATDDGELLDSVISSLRYVKIIRPGDSIPREILDGSASWKIEDYHYEIASARVKRRMLIDPSIDEPSSLEFGDLKSFGKDAKTHQEIVEAMGVLAVRLGLGTAAHEVGKRLEILARELAYTEALRERCLTILDIRTKLGHFARVYKTDRTVSGEIAQLERLIRRPISELEGIFEDLDAHLTDIYAVLGNVPTYIKFVREARDELHVRMMAWDEQVAIWSDVDITRNPNNDQMLRNLYRFLAQNFSVKQAWQLTTMNSR